MQSPLSRQLSLYWLNKKSTSCKFSQRLSLGIS
nr:MAG TPA: hypothetical protein [Caudoviricetes sp.]